MTADPADRKFTDAQLDEVRDRNAVPDVAGQWVTLRHKGSGYVGPCPICSANDSSRTAQRFECDSEKWVCAVCEDGGDVIKLVQKREGVGFVAAVERLGGVRPEIITPLSADRAGRKAYRAADLKTDTPASLPALYGANAALRDAFLAGWAKAHKAEAYAATARERERKRLFDFWKAARPIDGTPADAYLVGRGLWWHPAARLRCHDAMPYFADGREREPLLVHRGPAMLAAILGADGRFTGLHITWLDPRGPKGKAALVHPHTGEALPAKKVRGTMAGGYIDLGGTGEPRRMFAGEGIETVLAVYTAYARRDLGRAGDWFRSSIALGNLAGRALENVRHPSLKDAAGRARKVPGPSPDLTSAAMPVPLTVRDLILLGDGDSDAFTTSTAMLRAQRRHTRESLLPRIQMARPGLDFNDMAMRRTAPPDDKPEVLQ